MHARLYAQIRRRLFFPAHGTHVYRHWQCHTPRSPLWRHPQNRKYIVKGTEPRLQITHIENFVKFGLVIRFEARVQLNIGFTFESAPYGQFYRFPPAEFHEIWTQHVHRCRDESFWNRLLKFSNKGSFCQKRKKSFISAYCDFGPPLLGNDYRSTEICCEMISLRNV